MATTRATLTRLSCLLAALSIVAAPVAAADPDAPGDPCPFKVSTPPAVDSSEVPTAGPPPEPLPVPDAPVGGEALGGCGIVAAPGTPPLPDDVSAEAWLVADLDSGDVIAARDPHARHRPASIIKVLVALASLKELPLNKQVMGTADDEAAEGTRIGVKDGQPYTVDELLHGLLMHSGNDAAHALAVQLGGMDVATRKINELAGKLGGHDTRAATPSGLDGPGMSTSAYDLGLFYRFAWQNRVFSDIVASRTYDLPEYQLENDNKLLYNYPGAMGGKTGYTDDAGQTFVGAANRDGRRLVAILLKGTRQPIAPWEQAAHLLDYGFAVPVGTRVGTLVEPDPSLTATNPNANPAAPGTPAAAAAADLAGSRLDPVPVRVGVGVVGVVVVLSLIMSARSLNRRTVRVN